MKKNVLVNKTYKLTKDAAPLSFMLPTRNSRRYPLMYFDESTGTNRALRYARNQKSPFEDEQDGNAILEPIVFEDGMLVVQRENQVLQKFLHYHPGNGMVFEEIDNAKDASEELASVELTIDAQVLAKNLSTDKLLSVSRILMGASVNSMTIPELKRDILVYAKNNPEELIDIVNDPLLELQNEVHLFVDNNWLSFRNNRRDVYYNLPGNKKKMMSVPFNEDPYDAISAFLQSNDGLEAYKYLKKRLKKDK